MPQPLYLSVANQKDGGITRSLQFADATADGTDSKQSASILRTIRYDGANRHRTRNGDCQQYGTSAAGARNHPAVEQPATTQALGMSQISQAPLQAWFKRHRHQW